MAFTQKNPEVFITNSAIVTVSPEDISFLKKQATTNPRKRARICAHRDNQETVHEMIIAIADSSYIRPHMHMGKSESFHIIEGEADVALFEEDGTLSQVIRLGAPGTGKNPFYRLSEPRFHTVLVRSDILVMHEVTTGPFIREQTLTAPFAPDEADTENAARYAKELGERIAQHIQKNS